jgi:L-histidine N-alpha-methyltransferase
MSAFRPAVLHDSVRAGAVRARRAASLHTGEMDHAFHYAGARQAELWLEVHRRHAPLFADPAFEGIYRELFATLALELAGRPAHVIGLGAGGGRKESWLLEALHRAGCPLRYTPVDASLDLAWLSAEVGAPFVADSVPLVGDLSLLPDLPAWLDRDPAEAIRVYTAFGFIFNFPPGRILPWLRGALRPRDILLLSANLAPVAGDESGAAYRAACETILPQYDNPETRNWLRQVLFDFGIAGDLSEPFVRVETLEGLLGCVARSEWLRDVAFDWEGEPFAARRGDTLRLFFSLRYTPERLAATARRHGLILGEGRVTPCGQEGVWRMEAKK